MFKGNNFVLALRCKNSALFIKFMLFYYKIAKKYIIRDYTSNNGLWL